jgi:hypothetical protein
MKCETGSYCDPRAPKPQGTGLPWRPAIGLDVGKLEIIAEGAVDELGAGVGIEQHDADFDLIERRRQTLRGGVMHTLPVEGLDQPFPQYPGDAGGADRGHRQHQQANQICGLIASWCAVIEEEHRGRSDRDGGADHAGRETAERACECDDANEQRRRIRNDNKIAVDKDGDQSRRCRQSRTGDCAPVELHACSRSPRE